VGFYVVFQSCSTINTKRYAIDRNSETDDTGCVEGREGNMYRTENKPPLCKRWSETNYISRCDRVSSRLMDQSRHIASLLIVRRPLGVVQRSLLRACLEELGVSTCWAIFTGLLDSELNHIRPQSLRNIQLREVKDSKILIGNTLGDLIEWPDQLLGTIKTIYR
jgi:hypothetical protein